MSDEPNDDSDDDDVQASALPLDSDVDAGPFTPHKAARVLHLRPSFIAVVGVGGALGALVRYLVSVFVPALWGLPWPTFIVNVVGAFTLGMLMEGLARRGHDSGIRRILRLGVGTGFLGGFTTYSSLAVEADQLLRAGQVWEAVGYGVITVVLGLLAALFGMWVASVRHRAGTDDNVINGTAS